MERAEFADALRKSHLFAGLGREAPREISAALIVQSWPKMRQITGPSDTSDRFFIVIDGRVKVTRSNAHEGRDLTLAREIPKRADVIIERWHDLSAQQAHSVAPHMQVFRERIGGAIVSTTLHVLSPA